MEVFLVGGAVRDGLLKLPVKERDWVVVGATPELMRQKGYQSVGKEFPVFLHPQTKEEYALARAERKVGKGYHGFEFTTTPHISLEEDLRRRDLTINAMAQDKQGCIIDPYGGQDDLQGKVLRHVSEAFKEDPVRVLRVARFHARYQVHQFYVHASTLDLMSEMVRNSEVSALVAERVWHECVAAMEEPRPAAFLETLQAVQALEVLAPDISAAFSRFASKITTAINSVAHDSPCKAQLVLSILASWVAHADGSLALWCEKIKAPLIYRKHIALAESLYHLLALNKPLHAESLWTFFKRHHLRQQAQRFYQLEPVWEYYAFDQDQAVFRKMCAALGAVLSQDLAKALEGVEPKQKKALVESLHIQAIEKVL